LQTNFTLTIVPFRSRTTAPFGEKASDICHNKEDTLVLSNQVQFSRVNGDSGQLKIILQSSLSSRCLPHWLKFLGCSWSKSLVPANLIES